MDVSGEYGTIRWFADDADLGAFEKNANQVIADQEYWQKAKRVADLFIQGSMCDTVMRSI